MKVSSGLNAVIALRYGLRGYFAFLTLWNTHFHRTSVPAKLNVGFPENNLVNYSQSSTARTCQQLSGAISQSRIRFRP
jgi:hypothetical protein